MLTPQQMAANWAQGAQGKGSQNYRAGVQAVQESPTAKAATDQAEAAYLAGVQQASASGRRRARLNAVSLQQWKDATLSKGATNYGQGVQQAVNKMQSVYQQWAPVYAQAAAAAAAIPHVRGNQASALARVQAAMQVLQNAAQRG